MLVVTKNKFGPKSYRKMTKGKEKKRKTLDFYNITYVTLSISSSSGCFIEEDLFIHIHLAILQGNKS